MDRQELLEFNREAANTRAELFGQKAIFRGEEITVLEASAEASLSAGVGGYTAGGIWNIRIPIEILPPPRAKEEIVQVGTGIVFVISSCKLASDDSTTNFFHYVETRKRP